MKSGTAYAVKKTLLIMLSVVLSVVLVVLVAGTAYMEYMLNLIKREPDNNTIPTGEQQGYLDNTGPSGADWTDPTDVTDPSKGADSTDPTKPSENTDPTTPSENTEPTIPTDPITWEPWDDPVIKKEHIINIMLIGEDRRPGEYRARSDAMILCTINTKSKEVTLTSFMRDTYVQIPGYQSNRINESYMLGGMKLVSKCLETNFGVYVDGSVAVDFDGFTSVIDMVGGVDIELSSAEASFMAKQGYKVKAGMNHMDGATALSYARNRWVGNTDFARTERHRKIISALIDKCRGMNFIQLSGLLNKVLPLVTTDMTNAQMLKCMMEMVPLLKNLKINTQRIPGDYFEFAVIRGLDVIVPDIEDCRRILQNCMK